MPEHLIRLRGGWLLLDPGAVPPRATGTAQQRVTLPITWPDEAGSAVAVRLVRSFGPPPLDRAHERLALRLADVGGLVSAALNGQEIARPAPGATALEIPLAFPLASRNRLVLEVDVTRANHRPWGTIALVVSRRESSPGTGLPGSSGAKTRDTAGGNGNDMLGGTVC
jgi:hypothetical protein